MASVARHRIALLVTVILCLTGLVILARAREHSAKHAHAGKAIEIMVQEEIANHRVIIFSKSYCPYCMKAKRLFKDMGVPFKAIEMDLDERGVSMKQYLASFTHQHTVPNVFINGMHVGGYDRTQALKDSGELETMLGKKFPPSYDEL